MFDDLLKLDKDVTIEMDLKKEEEFLNEFLKCKDHKEFKEKQLEIYQKIDISGDYALLKIFWKAVSRYKYIRGKKQNETQI